MLAEPLIDVAVTLAVLVWLLSRAGSDAYPRRTRWLAPLGWVVFAVGVFAGPSLLAWVGTAVMVTGFLADQGAQTGAGAH
ncbi:MAG: hypothetical protein M3Q27_14230 [Actinomycetota bacterium]|nr:hypothetical protein [Actinomycetota bacterium]